MTIVRIERKTFELSKATQGKVVLLSIWERGRDFGVKLTMREETGRWLWSLLHKAAKGDLRAAITSTCREGEAKFIAKLLRNKNGEFIQVAKIGGGKDSRGQNLSIPNEGNGESWLRLAEAMKKFYENQARVAQKHSWNNKLVGGVRKGVDLQNKQQKVSKTINTVRTWSQVVVEGGRSAGPNRRLMPKLINKVEEEDWNLGVVVEVKSRGIGWMEVTKAIKKEFGMGTKLGLVSFSYMT